MVTKGDDRTFQNHTCLSLRQRAVLKFVGDRKSKYRVLLNGSNERTAVTNVP